MPEQEKDELSQSAEQSELSLVVMRDIDETVYWHLTINTVLAVMTGLFIFYIFANEQQLNWWSLCLLAAFVFVIAIEDMLRWVRWQLVLERSLKCQPREGFWVEISEAENQMKAEIGNNNYPDRSLWQCDLLPGRISENCQRLEVSVYLHPDGVVPVAFETAKQVVLLKPAVKGMSLSLLEFFSSCLNKLFPRKPSK